MIYRNEAVAWCSFFFFYILWILCADSSDLAMIDRHIACAQKICFENQAGSPPLPLGLWFNILSSYLWLFLSSEIIEHVIIKQSLYSEQYSSSIILLFFDMIYV